MTGQWKYMIYGLVDPRTGAVRYVGKSSSGMKRPRDHLKPSHIAKETNRHKAHWLRGLRRIGIRAGIRVIEEVPHAEMLDDSERWWIQHARAAGWPLTNIADGGEHSSVRDPAIGKTISQKLIGHPVSESTRRAVAESNRTRVPYVRTPEMRQASRDRQLGKKITGSHLGNLRAAVVRREEKRRHNKRAQSVRDGQGEFNGSA